MPGSTPPRDAEYAANLGHEFIRSLSDVSRENEELRKEIRGLRKQLCSLQGSVNDLTTIVAQFGALIEKLAAQFNVAQGFGRIVAGFLGYKRR